MDFSTTSIVILNWNGQHFLERYLPDIALYSQLPGVSVIVADNASTDGSLAYLQVHHPHVRIIVLDKNYGFAEGYNRALLQVDSDYYVLLNSDVAVTEGWLQPMLHLMQQQPDVAACMPKLKSVDARDYFEYAGAAGGFIDKYGYPFCRGRLFDCVEKDDGQYDTASEVFWATGACCMVNAALFRQMGGFDSAFFAHMEEIDLCWRLKNAGYKIWYVPESTVYHVGGGMLPQSSPFKTYLNYRNNLLMMYKNLPSNRRMQIMFIRMLLDGISAVVSFLKGDWVSVKAIWKAHRAFWKMKPQYRNQKNSTIDTYPSCVYHYSIVWQYFVKKTRKYSEIESAIAKT